MEYFALNNGTRMPMAGIGVFKLSPEEAEASVESALRSGIRLIDKAPRGGAEGLSIAFLHPKSTFGVLTELCEDKNK